MFKPLIAALFVSASLALASLPARAATPEAVLNTYSDIAQAMYGDALRSARHLLRKVETLTAKPSEQNLIAARDAWIAARVPYQQTEVYRFGNPIVDEWEGRVNAWPLDEGLIDYVDSEKYGESSDANPWYGANIIANTKLEIGGRKVDTSRITWRTLRGLQEVGGVEANVATGYHAVEFLLWGQDLNGTGPGAGNRPWTDYAKGAACTNGNCDRRAAYLLVATQLLVDDLAWMAGQWGPQGEARKHLLADPNAGIATMVTGLGSLAYGELAGERMKLGLLLHDPEEEHDCFSDNTHNSHYYNVVGMQAIYLGRYGKISGPGLTALVAEKASALDSEMRGKLDASLAAMGKVKQRAETVERYDQMLAEGNAEGAAVLEGAIAALIDQTRTLERISAALQLGKVAFEGSDSLDSPDKVGKK
ncbi:imelysin family protein [Ferrovibrio sp.]|uniref:imelysin family protein n=1 Tax=Ferrovibrio sp. TaxID=1917215 RepID=UPI0025BF4A0D|nr:imelysin family protein [Ferrovibrio sp.]